MCRATDAVPLSTIGRSEPVERVALHDGDAVIVDLHVWRNRGSSRIVGLVADRPLTPDEYKQKLAVHEELAHVTVEVHHCRGDHPHPGRTDCGLTVPTAGKGEIGRFGELTT
jgi:hypothetical protein